MTQFYTYLHCKPNGDPFYVGKGTVKRSREFKSGRNRHYKNIIAVHGKENIGVFIFPCDSEQQALGDEIQQIAQLRHEGYELCNYTDGGEGTSGYTVSPETRLKQSIAKIGNVASEETRKKMSLSQSARWAAMMEENTVFKHSDETRKKIREARAKQVMAKGKKLSAIHCASLISAWKRRKEKFPILRNNAGRFIS